MPLPDGPTMAQEPPAGTEKETSLRTVRLFSLAEPLRYVFVSLLASRIGVTVFSFHFERTESNDSEEFRWAKAR